MRCVFLVFCFLGSMLFHIQGSCSCEVDSLDPFSVEHVQRFLGEEWQVVHVNQTVENGAPHIQAKFVSKRNNNRTFYVNLGQPFKDEKASFSQATKVWDMQTSMKMGLLGHQMYGQATVYGETIIDQTPNSIVYAFIKERPGYRKYIRTKAIFSERGLRTYSYYSDVLEKVDEETSYWKKKFSELH